MNKLDKNIKEKLADRTFTPSASAWERLSVQLEEQPQKKTKGWFFYIGIAASILLLLAIGIQFLSSDSTEDSPIKEVIVESPIDTNVIDKKIKEMFNEVPVEEAIVNANIKEDKEEMKKQNSNKVIANKVEKSRLKENTTPTKNNISIAQLKNSQKKVISSKKELLTKKKIIVTNKYKQNPNSRIKINSEDLLFAVTNSSSKIENSYAKLNLNREDVLITIKRELKKSNIKINPNTILAEVERNIDDDAFQNDFMKTLKSKITGIASAIASRND